MALLQLIGVITLFATVRTEAELCNNLKSTNTQNVCNQITFRFQTRNTSGDGILVTESNLDTIRLEYFGDLKIMMHGYKGNKNYNPNSLLVPAYLKQKNHNILIVDWNKTDSNSTVTYNIRIAGECTARLLQQLIAKKGKGLRYFTHIIGFSLGAHAAGIVGHRIKGLARITGLDPARLEFTEHISSASYRLDHSDAELVDVYHSNGGKYGSLWPSGDVDFYINNGINQTGCDTDSCSHFRSVEVFAKSIGNPTAFYGQYCKIKRSSYLPGDPKEICAYVEHLKANLIPLIFHRVPERDSTGVYAGDPITRKPERRTYKFETYKVSFWSGAE